MKLSGVNHRVNQKGSISRGGLPGLTPKEERVLALFKLHGNNPQKIATAEKCAVSLVHRYLRRLEKKGALHRGSQQVHKGGTLPRSVNLDGVTGRWRCHAVRFTVGVPAESLDRYRAYTKKKNTAVEVKGCTVFLWETMLDFRPPAGESFFGDRPFDAVEAALPYVRRIISVFESDANLLLIKDRRPNLRLSYFELSETHNEISGHYQSRGEGLSIAAPEDGKVWLKIDNSFKLDELEFVRNGSQVSDADSVIRNVQDWRRHPEVPRASDLALALDRFAKIAEGIASANAETARAVSVLAAYESRRTGSVGAEVGADDFSEIRRYTG